MKFKHLTLEKTLPYILIVIGIIGFIMSVVIMQEKINMASNPNYIPSCNINPVVSCGTVMKSAQSHAFGFSNPYIGLAAYPAAVVVGVAILAGARFKRWFWVLFNIGFVFAVGFVHWLFYQTVYEIHAVCPFCTGVWATSIIGFWYVTLYNIDKGHIVLPTKAKKGYAWVRRHHLDLLVLWFLILAGLILKHFWYYYGRNIHIF